ncbi:MAG: NFACT RNA binding domain-containing protein [Firmicutes bacterium]|nr:NFACT RNA binding domain-containing protein [Bacillota bacterium]
MPFDALAMRAIEARWQREVAGATCMKSLAGPDRLLWFLRRDRATFQILIVLDPGLKRLHRTSATELREGRPLPWLERLLPFTIESVTVPTLERVMYLTITHRNEWDVPHQATLVVELAGHLTNLVWLDENRRVVDAWRKVAPDRPGRTIWPQEAYSPPPPTADPFPSQNAAALPPYARLWLQSRGNWEQLWQDFLGGFPDPCWELDSGHERDVWVYPLPDFEARPVANFEQALDRVFAQREALRFEHQLRQQLISHLDRRIQVLNEKIAQATNDLREDWEAHKRTGDLWLAYQSAFSPANEPVSHTVLDENGQAVTLTLLPGESPIDRAHAAYRQYKKVKARHQALSQLIPAYQAELETLQKLKDAAHASHPLEWYRDLLKQQSKAAQQAQTLGPFRRFKSLHGLDILVGRNREENQELTFRTARPDDLWFHTKQAPGSHVILQCGRTNPDLEDLIDAATLAVFFSPAHASSHVPVDYTRRKYVRKRPHAEPGAVLYRMEKTLYITPELARLHRLGATREKLIYADRRQSQSTPDTPTAHD